jgi:hypothetical protein
MEFENTAGTTPNLLYRVYGQGLGQHRLGWARDLVHPLSGVSTSRLSVFGVALYATLHEVERRVRCGTSLRIAEAEMRLSRRNGRASLVAWLLEGNRDVRSRRETRT